MLRIFFIQGSTDETVYEGTTEYWYYEGETEDYSQDFTLHIYSATAYEFLVNVAAPDLEIYGSTDMKSEDASIICYSNPSKLLGKPKETIKEL